MAKSESKTSKKETNLQRAVKNASCGLVMPISALDGYSAEHWEEVKSIIIEAVDSIKSPKFLVKLVSDADDIGIIQKRIVQNIYTNDIIICDVSGKNPNVMFELGMRLGFDKPVVIVKDDKTDYSFDTGIIEHITYPRDLRFSYIVDFKKTLASKVTGTYKTSINKPDQSPFLKNFGKITLANQNDTAVSSNPSLPASFFVRKALISKTQKELLEYIERKNSVQRNAIQKEFSSISSSELFYRLEQLRLLGFIEQGPIGKASDTISTQMYRLSKSYRKEIKEKLGPRLHTV
jgi:hypothetical protein